jgi:hypothetical protein
LLCDGPARGPHGFPQRPGCEEDEVGAGSGEDPFASAGPGLGSPVMVTTVLRAPQHIAAWLVWHAARVSLLPDAERPQVPGEAGS